MKYTVIDIESTGLSTQYDNPLSVAYLTFNDDFTQVVDSGILYFYQHGMKWSMEAEAVHGLSREFLSQYVDDYSKNLRKLFKILTRGNLIGHNIETFDSKMLSNFLAREMYGFAEYNKLLDTMRIFQPVFKKRMKLTNLTTELGANDFVLNNLHKKWFGYTPQQSWHTASFDVTATAFCYLEGRRRGICG